MEEFVAAIDQGTTSTRCIIFDKMGEIKASVQEEHTQIYPRPGWVEHDPLEIWERTQEVVQAAVNSAGEDHSAITALGITNQRETTVLWDKITGIPYTNAIVWQDTRTKAICDRLASEEGFDRFRPKVGLPLATYFSGPKIQWILENHPEARIAARGGSVLFGTMDTWLIWWLTGGPNGGVHITDVTNASRTMLMNLETLNWDSEILDIFNIPHQILPRIVPSSDSEPWGYTKQTGPFQGRIPICGDLGDQQAALVGQVCFNPGEGKNTYGTGCFLLLNTGPKIVQSKSGLLTTLAYRLDKAPPVYALEGSVAIAGALVQWLRDNLDLIKTAPEVESLARTVDDNGGVYFVPAFSGLFAPYWRSDARGIIAGLSRFSNKGHLARASLEATAYQTFEVLDAMQRDWGISLNMLKVDGGMVTNELLMQFQADLLGVPVVRSKISETTALGAAYVAGLAVGFWSNQEELQANWQASCTWQPSMSESERQRLLHDWRKAVERTLGWIE